MELMPQIFMAKVMHKRFFPRVHAFTHDVYYMCLPLSALEHLPRNAVFNIDRPALFSFYQKDHGARDGSDARAWARTLLAQHGIDGADDEIMLVTMPRILGFVFNPVSFWMVYARDGGLRAVIAEVNNTFGESHSYLCANSDGTPLQRDEWMNAEKLFHVSPFLERKGHYTFRFHDHETSLGIWIDYYHENGEKQLATSLLGKLAPMDTGALLKAFVTIPFVTLKTIVLIHWHAVLLVLKKIKYIDKPPQLRVRSSAVKGNLTDL